MHLTDDSDIIPVNQPKANGGGGDSAATVESRLYDLLVGGTDINGAKAPATFRCLYNAFPVAEPAKNSPLYRNWQFLKSSADLLIGDRPLASYFSHMSPTAAAEPTDSSAVDNEAITMAAARQAMTARTKMRRLIVTSEGRLGLAPGQTRPGDAVILVVGHGKPLIARKVATQEGQDFWYLIGEAYVQGMMNSELMKLSDNPWNRSENTTTIQTLTVIPFV